MILIKLIGITSLLVLGWKIVTSEGMLLESVGDKIKQKVDEGYKYFELLQCPWCMSGVWSLLGFAFAYGLGIISIEWRLLLLYPLCVCGSSLVCGFTWSLHLMMDAIKENNETQKDTLYYNFEQEEE